NGRNFDVVCARRQIWNAVKALLVGDDFSCLVGGLLDGFDLGFGNRRARRVGHLTADRPTIVLSECGDGQKRHQHEIPRPDTVKPLPIQMIWIPLSESKPAYLKIHSCNLEFRVFSTLAFADTRDRLFYESDVNSAATCRRCSSRHPSEWKRKSSGIWF